MSEDYGAPTLGTDPALAAVPIEEPRQTLYEKMQPERPAEAKVVPEVRFDVFVDGVLADSETLLVTKPNDLDVVGARQSELCHQAEAAGKKYLVDIAWFDGTHTRWGTDADGMVLPIEVGLASLMETLDRLIDHRHCTASKMGYVCQRGDELHAASPDLHAQLVHRLPDGNLRIAFWRDDIGGVRLTKVNLEEASKLLAQLAEAVYTSVADGD